jgi:hypothetical protein
VSPDLNHAFGIGGHEIVQRKGARPSSSPAFWVTSRRSENRCDRMAVMLTTHLATIAMALS